jgi:hypothetical protein
MRSGGISSSLALALQLASVNNPRFFSGEFGIGHLALVNVDDIKMQKKTNIAGTTSIEAPRALKNKAFGVDVCRYQRHMTTTKERPCAPF